MTIENTWHSLCINQTWKGPIPPLSRNWLELRWGSREWLMKIVTFLATFFKNSLNFILFFSEIQITRLTNYGKLVWSEREACRMHTLSSFVLGLLGILQLTHRTLSAWAVALPGARLPPTCARLHTPDEHNSFGPTVPLLVRVIRGMQSNCQTVRKPPDWSRRQLCPSGGHYIYNT